VRIIVTDTQIPGRNRESRSGLHLSVSMVLNYGFQKRTPPPSSAKTLLASERGVLFDALWLVRKLAGAGIAFGLCDRYVDW